MFPSGSDIHCEWGEKGVEALRGSADAIVIVDILSFSTAVEIATARGAVVIPYRWKDDSARSLAERAGAELAGPRGAGSWSLSPASLESAFPGLKLVLPSPNGSTLSLATGGVPTFAASLRNAEAAAQAARACGRSVAVIPAGERWRGGSLRPALEDWLGAGAVIEHLGESLSAEAWAAREAFRAARPQLRELLFGSVSGSELAAKGYARDVDLAAELLVSGCVPRLQDGIYLDVSVRSAAERP